MSVYAAIQRCADRIRINALCNAIHDEQTGRCTAITIQVINIGKRTVPVESLVQLYADKSTYTMQFKDGTKWLQHGESFTAQISKEDFLMVNGASPLMDILIEDHEGNRHKIEQSKAAVARLDQPSFIKGV